MDLQFTVDNSNGLQFNLVQFSRSVMSDSLRPNESQHARPPCPSPTPGVHSDSRPSSQWCHPAVSILCCPLCLLPPIPPSFRVFFNESTLRMRWPKYWSFSFSIISSKEIPGLISFRTDWLDLLAVQGTLKSLLQHHSILHRNCQPSASWLDFVVLCYFLSIFYRDNYMLCKFEIL